MKREGRQHGMVRTYEIVPTLHQRLETRAANRLLLDSPPTAGLFCRVSAKPTNHSKFTGKCGKPRCNDCHLSPACKAKNKTKGNHKIKSSNDTVFNNRLSHTGNSATSALNQLAPYHDHHDYDDEDQDPEEFGEMNF